MVHDIIKYMQKKYNRIKFTADRKYDEQLINCDFYDKVTEEALYCKIRKQNNEHYKWIMDDKLYKASELYGCKLPASSRLKPSFLLEMNHIQDITLNQNIIQQILRGIKWKNIPIFNRKNNKNRMSLSILPNQINSKIRSCMNSNLIPILMFNNNSHWIEYIMVVNIDRNIDIGISLKYHPQNGPSITSIHLDKEYIKSAHESISPHDCQCLDGFNSIIHDIHIGNPDDLLNQMKTYKQKYETIKQFIYKFMDEKELEGFESLKQDAKVFMQHDNATLKNWIVPQLFTSPSSSPLSTTSTSLCDTAFLNGYSSTNSSLYIESTISPSTTLSSQTESMVIDENINNNVDDIDMHMIGNIDLTSNDNQ